jgi:hypothetical protein
MRKLIDREQQVNHIRQDLVQKLEVVLFYYYGRLVLRLGGRPGYCGATRRDDDKLDDFLTI